MRKRRALLVYLGRRLGFAIAAWLFFAVLIFALPRAIPGNPVALLLANLAQQGQVNPELIREVYRRFMDEFGLGLPLWQQFSQYFGRLLQGDLGTSISMFPQKVADILGTFLPWTVALLLPAVCIGWLLGNYLGALVAWKKGLDRVATPVFLTISQTPFYWFAMLVLFSFAVKLRFFPIGGTFSWGLRPALTLDFIKDYLRHYCLPFLSLVLVSIGGWAIGMRSMMIYERRSDYVLFAEALGLPDRYLLRYAFRSAMLPQITGLALNFGLMLGGSLLVELVFNYRGMGSITFQALTTLDYPLIQGIFIILSTTVIMANLVVDIVYGLVDPRIRTGFSGG
jgi:peptide/nickel transport system permease protein